MPDQKIIDNANNDKSLKENYPSFKLPVAESTSTQQIQLPSELKLDPNIIKKLELNKEEEKIKEEALKTGTGYRKSTTKPTSEMSSSEVISNVLNRTI